jgi:hypothetical protein
MILAVMRPDSEPFLAPAAAALQATSARGLERLKVRLHSRNSPDEWSLAA